MPLDSPQVWYVSPFFTVLTTGESKLADSRTFSSATRISTIPIPSVEGGVVTGGVTVEPLSSACTAAKKLFQRPSSKIRCGQFLTDLELPFLTPISVQLL